MVVGVVVVVVVVVGGGGGEGVHGERKRLSNIFDCRCLQGQSSSTLMKYVT